MTYTWLFMFMPSIPLDQSSLVVGWSFYNSKNSEPNGSASPFGRRNKKTFSYLWARIRAPYSAIAIARPYARRSPCRNPLPNGKNKMAGATLRASTNNSDTFCHTSAVSRISTPALAPPLASAKLVAKYTNADLQRAIKLALKLFVQGQQQAQSQIAPPALETQERPLKARFPDLYYNNLYMDCYWFCQQCKDHFKTAKAKRPNKIPFAALFLRGLVI